MNVTQLERKFVESLSHGISKGEAAELQQLASKYHNPDAVLARVVNRYAPSDRKERQAFRALGIDPKTVDTGVPQILPSRQQQLSEAYELLRDDLGEPIGGPSKSATFAEAVIRQSGYPVVGGAKISALVPVASRFPPIVVNDPNKVDTFYIERRVSGVHPDHAIKIFGPFSLEATIGSTGTGPVSLHVIDKDRTVQLSKGETLTIELPEASASAGVKWTTGGENRSFGYPTNEEYLPNVVARRIGGSGTRKFTWNTAGNPYINIGETHDVSLELRRGGQVLDTFRVSVEIV